MLKKLLPLFFAAIAALPSFAADGSVWCEIGRCTADIPN
jgi:hypothetical protein